MLHSSSFTLNCNLEPHSRNRAPGRCVARVGPPNSRAGAADLRLFWGSESWTRRHADRCGWRERMAVAVSSACWRTLAGTSPAPRAIFLDGGQVLALADEVERAERFPHFAHAGIDEQDRLAFSYRGLIGDKPLADSTGNLRAQFACGVAGSNVADERAGIDALARLQAFVEGAGFVRGRSRRAAAWHEFRLGRRRRRSALDLGRRSGGPWDWGPAGDAAVPGGNRRRNYPDP